MGTNGKLSLNLGALFQNMKPWQAGFMIVLILIAAGWASEHGANVSVNVSIEERVQAIENRLDIPVNSSLSGFLKSNTYMVSLVDTYATLMNGANAHLIEFLTNHTQVMDDALSNASTAGGSVYVAAGAYTAPGVVVQNNTRFAIDRGATGIMYTVASGATCIIDDLNSGVFAYYLNGIAYSIFNYAQGTLLTQTANLTTVYVQTLTSQSGNLQILKLVIENGTSFPNSTTAGYMFYRQDLYTLYYYNSTNWVACSGGGGGSGPDDDSMYLLSSSATNFLFQNGTRPLTANWGTGSFGIYSMTFVNVTSLYCATINQLVSGQGVSILNFIIQTGTSFPASPINYEVFYRSDQGLLYVYNSGWSQVGYTPSTYPYANLTGIPVLLFADGTQALTGNWNVGGSYGVYGATWLNSTQINAFDFWWNGQNRTDAVANPTSTCTYIISTDSTNYFLKNGTTGQISQSTSFDSVLDSAMNNCSGNSGNLIFLGSGTFWVTRPHGIIYCNMTIEGSGPDSTTIKLAAGANCDIFNQTNIATAPPNPFFTVRDLTLNGNWLNNAYGCGINVGDANRSLCADLYVYNVWTTYFNGWGLDINATWSPILDRCIVENCLNGVYFYATEGSISQSFISVNTYVGLEMFGDDSCSVSNNGFWKNGCDGLWIYSTKRSTISGNRFEANSYLHENVYSDIKMNGTTFNNTISANNIDGLYGTQNYPKYGLDMSTGTLTNNAITGNEISTWNTSSILPASGNHFEGNVGFVTENDVTANNITATTFSFLHGLAGTPTSLSIVFNTDSVIGYTWSANATGVTVTLTNYQGVGNPTYLFPLWSVPISSQVGTINRTFLQPIIITSNCTIDRIVTSLAVASSGQNCRLGIYADNGTHSPQGGTLLFQSANIGTTTAQEVGAAVSNLVLAAGMYWVAIQTSDATQAFFRFTSNFDFTYAPADEMMGGCYYDSSTWGMNATCPTVTYGVAARPIILLHASVWGTPLPATITCTCHLTYQP